MPSEFHEDKKTTRAGIPKIIWMFWMQSASNAPNFVKANFVSWRRHNPDWEVVVLDINSLTNYIDVSLIIEENKKYLSPAALSDIIRINLLSDYGGVWADSTVLCLRPLNEWIDSAVGESKFFCFSNGSRDRGIASWFIAASRGNGLATKWRDLTSSYWKNNVFRNQNTSEDVQRTLNAHLNRNRQSTAGWFSELVTQGVGVYPYFWFHYLFDIAIAEDPGSAGIWAATRKISGGPPSEYLRRNPLKLASPEEIKFVSTIDLQMLKFDRRVIPERLPSGSILEFLYIPYRDEFL
jgi:hypothetical protein